MKQTEKRLEPPLPTTPTLRSVSPVKVHGIFRGGGSGGGWVGGGARGASGDGVSPSL